MLQILRPQTQDKNGKYSDKFSDKYKEYEDLKQGFAHLPANHFVDVDLRSDQVDLARIQNSYHSLPEDQFGGGRFRAHSKVIVDLNSRTISVLPQSAYRQSKAYNEDLGDVSRPYEQLNSEVLESELLRRLIFKNIDFAIASQQINQKRFITVGLHQIRYLATPLCPSVSSPIWLHKDDEDLVFVHLFNLTSNTLGGDNLISKDCRSISSVIHLERPLETLALTKSVFHAVTPIGSMGGIAYRDILLVTLVNDEN